MLIKILFWVWFGVLACVSLMPGKILADTKLIFSATGFWEHVLAYGVLAWLGVKAFAGRRAVMVLAVVFVVSIGFEVLQVLFLSRTFNPLDVAANGLGLVVGFWIGRNKR